MARRGQAMLTIMPTPQMNAAMLTASPARPRLKYPFSVWTHFPRIRSRAKGPTTRTYAISARTTVVLVTTRNTWGCRILNSRTRTAITATLTTGTTGVLSRSEIRASRCEPGNPLSLAIAKIMRTAPVWLARQHTKMAMVTHTSSVSPRNVPRTLLTTYVRPTVDSSGAFRLPTAMKAVMSSSAPPTPEASSARMMAGGLFLRGLTVSSPTDPAVSNPHMMYRPSRRDTSRAPRYPAWYPALVPLVCITTPGPRLAWKRKSTTSRATATSSTVTPMLLTTLTTLVPSRETIVVPAIMMVPRMTPFVAAS